ncbi:hypothetical protein ABIB62_003995 [Mucilaginibacter sp. UYP25]
MASTSTDQPTNELLMNFDTLTDIRGYGNLRGDEKARLQTPKPFLTIYDSLVAYKNIKATVWLPDSIEIMANGYSYAPEKSLIWPKNWPDLKNAATIKRGENFYSIYLDKKPMKNFIKMLSSLKEKQAVEINGQKFSLSLPITFS